MKGMHYKTEKYEPSVSVVVVGENVEEKINNINQCDYPCLEVVVGDYTTKTNGEVIVFTDDKTMLDVEAIREIVKPFADNRVGCVVGLQTKREGNSSFWKYENTIKQLESRIGCVSGAPASLFAVKSSVMPRVAEIVLNKPFYITMKITENGKDVVFQESAKVYEEKTEGTNFEKHVQDAAGYWQALKLFPKMLIGRKGSFVFVSHRVMKCFVWMDMVVMMITSVILALAGVPLMLGILVLLSASILIMLLMNNSGRSLFGKILGIGHYFVMLNVAYFIGLFSRKEKRWIKGK